MPEYRPLLSVIIPIYNGEKYLNECLDSVVHQNFQNYELICVDDGSTDRSWSILESYEDQFPQVKIFHKENGGGGAGSARNFGIEKADGKYIYFMDCDDYLSRNDAFSIMIDHMEKNQLDLFLFDGTTRIEESKEEMWNLEYYRHAYRRKKTYGLFEKGYQMFSQMVQGGDYSSVVYLQCMRSELLHCNRMVFNERTVNEDTSFTFETFLLSNRTEHFSESLIVRRVHPDSLMQQEHKFYLHIYRLFLEWRRMVNFWKQHEYPFEVQENILRFVSGLEKRIKAMYQTLKLDEEKEKIKEIPAADRYILEKLLFDNSMNTLHSFVVPYHLLPRETNVVIYGAGAVGQEFYRKIAVDAYWNLVGIVDKCPRNGKNAEPISRLTEWEYDKILIAIRSRTIAEEVQNQLIHMGISRDKFLWCGDIYDRDEFYRKYYLNQIAELSY